MSAKKESKYLTLKLTRKFQLLLDSIKNNVPLVYETYPELIKTCVRRYYESLIQDGLISKEAQDKLIDAMVKKS